MGCLLFLAWAVPGPRVPAPGAPSELMRLYALLGVLALVFVVTRTFARSLDLAWVYGLMRQESRFVIQNSRRKRDQQKT